MVDVCIIGAGVVGMNIARELSRYSLRVCVLEKEPDVGCGCSKANSGIVHAGYSDRPGSLKAELCVAGNRLFKQLDAELHFGYRRTGSLVLAFQAADINTLEELLKQGKKNGVQELAIISGDQAREREPYLSPEVIAALYCGNAGVTSPYELVIALAENSIANGVDLRLNSEVTAIQPHTSGGFTITTCTDTLAARYVVNAAGIYSDRVANMSGLMDYRIHPRRGQYILLDKDQSHLIKSVIFQVPTELGKGILVTTTYHGNLMIGPNAEEVIDKADVGTDLETLREIAHAARKSVPGIDLRKALTSFAGNRPVANTEDFIIKTDCDKGIIHLIGIDSPGLTASPAIALKVVDMLKYHGLRLETNPAFQPCRQPIIRKKPIGFTGSIDSPEPYTQIICRCEQVTAVEIIDCLHRSIPVQSLDAVKRRTRAGMGRCQGAFCGPRVRELVAHELNIPATEVTQSDKHSSTLAQRAKRGDFMKL